ncbi:type IV pilus assembly protein PilM [Cytobacillus eiseniae]|uniref:Type IV pilus assembly protein PilM n=1 Tax=Cytobacillus eiseniae TaxID=762947 RepID=A0ABS4RCI8_9BACI|nr:pilus assembly protein PilM [Cytobacillus eiseniae]MBP2240590.1 type IV pilus assembly protein PilM [Cytobacillus eiseniae]
MAFRLQLGKQRAINLIIKDHVIRFTEFKNSDGIQIHRCEERFLPSGIIKEGKIVDHETLIMILEECVSDWKLKNRMVSFLVPDPYIVLRRIKVPAELEEDEIKGYLFMELGSSIHLPFEDPVFDFHLLEQNNSNEMEIILFAAPEDIVTDYTSVLEEVKLRPVAADVSSLALYRLFHKLNSSHITDSLMMIQFDLTTVNVSIFENHQPVFMRHLVMDIDPTDWIITKNERNSGQLLAYSGERIEVLNSLKDIYSEIDKVMNFYRYSIKQGKQQITKVFLDGDHPWLTDIYTEMKESMEVPVTQLDNRTLQMNGEIHNLSSFHLNFGLGLKEV